MGCRPCRRFQFENPEVLLMCNNNCLCNLFDGDNSMWIIILLLVILFCCACG